MGDAACVRVLHRGVPPNMSSRGIHAEETRERRSRLLASAAAPSNSPGSSGPLQTLIGNFFPKMEPILPLMSRGQRPSFASGALCRLLSECMGRRATPPSRRERSRYINVPRTPLWRPGFEEGHSSSWRRVDRTRQASIPPFLFTLLSLRARVHTPWAGAPLNTP